MDFKDYYKTLGVAHDATAEEIKKAFRRLARKYHPDISKLPDAEQHMKDVNEAYAVLSDAEKRAAYDQLGRGYRPGQEFHPPPDWDSGFEFSSRGYGAGETVDFSDFFAELFGRMGGARAPFAHRAGAYRERGEDHHAKISMDLEDAFRGAIRQITLRVPRMDKQGRVSLETRILNVNIPKGVCDGQIIRLAGQGAPSADNTNPGDLFLEVHFKPDPRFRVDGRNLHLKLPIAPWEAALGSIVAIDLPLGRLKVRIPEGVQCGRQLRVRGRGIPGESPGDLLLDIQVMIPPADTPHARVLYENMAREFSFDPRRQWAQNGGGQHA